MNKKVLSLAVAAAMAAPMAAMADAVVYGKIRQAVESYSMKASNHVNSDGDEFYYIGYAPTPTIHPGQEGWYAQPWPIDMGPWNLSGKLTAPDAEYARIQNYASRLGVKGDEDLGNGLKAVYKMEFGIAISEQANEFGGSDPITARNAYVGLAGNFGTLLVGRHDTPLKISTGALDAYTEALTDRRADGTVAYVSPNMYGMTLALAIVPGENEDADGMVDGYSVAAIYSNGGIHASAAYEGGDGGLDALGGDDFLMGELKQYRFGLGYDAGNFKVGAVYESVNIDANIVSLSSPPLNPNWLDGGEDVNDWDTWTIGAAFNFGNNTLKAKYFDVDGAILGQEIGHDGFAVGLDHNFSKRTQVYAIYVSSDGEYADILSMADMAELGLIPESHPYGILPYNADVTVWGVGLNHNF
jgi:predicted porin